jgi:uncharacterized protein
MAINIWKMNRKEIINITEEFVRQRLAGYDSGHDWWHTMRVKRLALYLNEQEKMCDSFTVEIASLLHDTADRKFTDGDQESAYEVVRLFMTGNGMSDISDRVMGVIRNVSFSNKNLSGRSEDPLLMILQDADRLDAIGAIGIARAFNYGGFRNRPIYDPEEKINEEGLSTIAHFYEKLLKLKEMMNTETGKRIAESRHLYLEEYLDQFNNEWNMDLSSL